MLEQDLFFEDFFVIKDVFQALGLNVFLLKAIVGIKETRRVDCGQIDKKTQTKRVGFHSKLHVWPPQRNPLKV
ncbi:MAG: hypothetical protein DRO00_08155 [Thermoproteota archaeon]|nr:MAG: hypothetical protein DRO00_08155 [Candidatus Korarchaeota archaeon]